MLNQFTTRPALSVFMLLLFLSLVFFLIRAAPPIIRKVRQSSSGERSKRVRRGSRRERVERTSADDVRVPRDAKFALWGCLILAPLVLALTPKKPDAELVHEEVVTVEVVAVDPPKNVYVDLKEVESGAVHNRIYLSRHFNSWERKLAVGRRVTVKKQTWLRLDNQQHFVQWPDLREKLEG